MLTQRVDISDSDTLPVTVTFILTGLQLATTYHVLVYGVGEGGPGDISRGEFKTSEGLLMLCCRCLLLHNIVERVGINEADHSRKSTQ